MASFGTGITFNAMSLKLILVKLKVLLKLLIFKTIFIKTLILHFKAKISNNIKLKAIFYILKYKYLVSTRIRNRIFLHKRFSSL